MLNVQCFCKHGSDPILCQQGCHDEAIEASYREWKSPKAEPAKDLQESGPTHELHRDGELLMLGRLWQLRAAMHCYRHHLSCELVIVRRSDDVVVEAHHYAPPARDREQMSRARAWTGTANEGGWGQ
jgi:hypothetical protein